MARHFLTPIDMGKLEVRNLRLHVLASAPSSPVTGQVYYNSTDNLAYVYNGSAWVPLRDTWVSSVGATSPIQSSGGATPTISILAASGSNAGSMSSAHYTLVQNATEVNTGSTIVKRDGSGNFAAGTITASTVTGLSAPSAGSDAVNKTYVDNLINGTDWKASVRVASTANINVASAPSSIDGVTLSAGDRVLLKNQSTGSENGIYVFNGASSALTRAADTDSSAEVTSGMATFVSEGTSNADTQWVLQTNDPITLGTTALTFAQIGAGSSYSGGTGINIAGNVISISTGYVGQTSIVTVGTITTGTWNGTIIGLAYGGTGADASTTVGKLTARQNLNAAGIYTTLIGDGSSTSISITQATHNLASNGAIIAAVRDASTGEEVLCDITVNNANGTVTFGFASAPTSNQYRITLIG